MKGVYWVSERCLEVEQRVSEGCLEGIWGQAKSGHAESEQAKSGQVMSRQVRNRSGQNRSCQDRDSRDLQSQPIMHLRMEDDSGIGPPCYALCYVVH